MSRASKTGVRGLYRDTDGRYRIDLRWTDPETGERRRHRERLPVRTNAESAKRRARQILDAALAGTFDPHREAPVTLHAALERYLEHCETHGIKSTRSRRTHAKGICVASRYAHLGREDLRAAVAAAAASLTLDGEVFAPSMPPGPGSKEANSAGL